MVLRMKVIFLDIDGVLNSNLRRAEKNGGYLEEKKIRLISTVVQRTGAVVVLHSGWRLWLTDSLRPINREAADLLSLLAKHGIRLYGRTPDFSDEEIRKTKRFSSIKAAEILSWLQDHSDVENYVVLDDLDLHSKLLAGHQIRPDSSKGLSEEDAARAVKMLNMV